MDVDTLMLNWKNLAGLQYRHLGNQYQYISKWLDGFNEMGNFSEFYKNMGDFFIEKGKPIHDSEWFTSNSIVYEEDKAALLKFGGTREGTPIVIVAPEAGHNSKIADYGPEQSLVQCALKNYGGEVYVVSKRPSKENNTHYALSDAIQTLKNCISHIGRPVHLIGLCQGGWQSTIYTATFPLDVKSLTRV